MRKICVTLFAAMLSIFALNALSNLQENIGLDSLVENYTATSDSVIQRMDVITAKVDSVHTQMKSDSEKNWLGKDIDKSNVWIAFAGLIIALITLGFGIAGTIYGALGYKASRDTANNVLRASFNVQKGQFDDLIRHLYRNLVCTLAFSQKVLEESTHKKATNILKKVCNTLIRKKEAHNEYPSEEHLLKLKVLPEDILHLEKYNNNSDIYTKMHELKLLLRNYDTEIDTALMHLKNKNVTLEEVKNDLDTLVYKPLHLINKIREITDDMKKSIDKEDKDADIDFDSSENAALRITREHIKKLDDWEKKNAPFGKYVDLTRTVSPFMKKTEREKNEKPISKPYDGLRRSRNLFYDNATIKALKKQDIFGSDKFDGYSRQIAKICKVVTGLTAFKDNILSEQYDFKQYFLTMLSIDVTIELNNIHMIKLD